MWAVHKTAMVLTGKGGTLLVCWQRRVLKDRWSVSTLLVALYSGSGLVPSHGSDASGHCSLKEG